MKDVRTVVSSTSELLRLESLIGRRRPVLYMTSNNHFRCLVLCRWFWRYLRGSFIVLVVQQQQKRNGNSEMYIKSHLVSLGMTSDWLISALTVEVRKPIYDYCGR